MSNKAAPHRKFVQTFVLAEQPNGYFVLNDIFRYINEEEEEEGPENEDPPAIEDATLPVTDVEAKTLTNSADSNQQQHNIEQIDKKLENVALNEVPALSEDVNADTALPHSSTTHENAEVAVADDTPVAAISATDTDDQFVQESTDTTDAIDEIEQERPKDPAPTPAAPTPAPVPAKATPTPTPASAASIKPSAPKTWANLVAANSVVAPAVPNQNSLNQTSPAPSQPKATPSSANPPTTPPISSNEDAQGRTPQNGNSGWQMAGQENAKRQNRQHSVSGNLEKDNVLAYIKNVNDRVDAASLKATLQQYGKIVYFDVSRPKVIYPFFAIHIFILTEPTELCVR